MLIGASPVPGGIELAIGAAAIRAWGGVRYGWRLPVSSAYGMRYHPTLHVEKMHTGIDIAVPTGTPVIAVFDGTIERVDAAGVGTGEVNGNAVLLGIGPWLFAYLHLSAVFVTVKQPVTRGQILGLVGATGRATGPHLHFQTYYQGRTIDPMLLYPSPLFYAV